MKSLYYYNDEHGYTKMNAKNKIRPLADGWTSCAGAIFTNKKGVQKLFMDNINC